MSARWPGIIFCVLLIVAVVSPRAAVPVLLIILAATIATIVLWPRTGHANDIKQSLSLRGQPAFAALLAFAGWAAVSTLWSLAPHDSIVKPAFLIQAAGAVVLAAIVIQRLNTKLERFLAEGALTAIAAGYAFTTVELLSDQAITRAVMTWFPSLYLGQVSQTIETDGVITQVSKHFKVVDGIVTNLSITNINRRVGLLACLLWPAILLVRNEPNAIRKTICAAAIAFSVFVMLIYGDHQSSQVAILGSAIIFAVAHWHPKRTRWALGALWAAAIALVVPAALIVATPSVYCDKGLFHSASHRVVIWGTTAHHVLDRPLLGVGADATPEASRMLKAADPHPEAGCENAKSGSPYGKYSRHAHNAYLQVWFELGLIGAALFLITGLVVLRAIGHFSRECQPYTQALFTTTALMIAFSYSLWQTWFLASITLGAVLLVLACLGHISSKDRTP